MRIYKDLYVNQYGQKFYAESQKDLQGQIKGRAAKVYQDVNGKTYHVGYVIGPHWLTRYQAVTKPV